MTIGGKLALFIGGTLLGSVGLKLLSGKDARKVYAQVTAATLRCKDEVMKQVELVQEGCSDILADAKQINAERAKKEEAKFIEECAAEKRAAVESAVESAAEKCAAAESAEK